MNSPQLYIIAGPNGAGKSTNFQHLLPKGIDYHDHDKVVKEFYDSDYLAFDYPEKHQAANDRATQLFQQKIEEVIKRHKSFAYETNFFITECMSTPSLFKKAGYALNAYFIALKDVQACIDRVQIRMAGGGHYVSDEEIHKRFKAGIKNINKYFNLFDNFYLIDSSTGDLAPMLHLQKGNIVEIRPDIPDYIKRNFQSIFK